MTNDADNKGRSNDETRIMKVLITGLSPFVSLAHFANIFPFSVREIRGDPLAAATPH